MPVNTRTQYRVPTLTDTNGDGIVDFRDAVSGGIYRIPGREGVVTRASLFQEHMGRFNQQLQQQAQQRTVQQQQAQQEAFRRRFPHGMGQGYGPSRWSTQPTPRIYNTIDRNRQRTTSSEPVRETYSQRIERIRMDQALQQAEEFSQRYGENYYEHPEVIAHYQRQRLQFANERPGAYEDPEVSRRRERLREELGLGPQPTGPVGETVHREPGWRPSFGQVVSAGIAVATGGSSALGQWALGQVGGHIVGRVAEEAGASPQTRRIIETGTSILIQRGGGSSGGGKGAGGSSGPSLPGGGGSDFSIDDLLGSNEEGGGPSGLNMEATMQASYNPAGGTDLNLELPMQAEEIYTDMTYQNYYSDGVEV